MKHCLSATRGRVGIFSGITSFGALLVMKKVVITQPYMVDVEDVPRPVPGLGEILVRATVTGISAGTEMNLYRGTNPDLVRLHWGERAVYPFHPGYNASVSSRTAGPMSPSFHPASGCWATGPMPSTAL